MKFNINNNVRVRLTKEGKEWHRKYWKDFWESIDQPDREYHPPKEDADGWSEWQLWILMETFGTVIGMGNDMMFETEIDIPCKYDNPLWEVEELVKEACK